MAAETTEVKYREGFFRGYSQCWHEHVTEPKLREAVRDHLDRVYDWFKSAEVNGTTKSLDPPKFKEQDAEAKPNPDDAFVLFSWAIRYDSRFDTYRKAKIFLDKHPDIRTHSPRPNRLLVHAGDWERAKPPANESPDDEPEESDAEVEARIREASERRGLDATDAM